MPEMPNAKTWGNPLENMKLWLIMRRSTHLKMTQLLPCNDHSFSIPVPSPSSQSAWVLILSCGHVLFQPAFWGSLPNHTPCLTGFSDLCTSPPADSAQ